MSYSYYQPFLDPAMFAGMGTGDPQALQSPDQAWAPPPVDVAPYRMREAQFNPYDYAVSTGATGQAGPWQQMIDGMGGRPEEFGDLSEGSRRTANNAGWGAAATAAANTYREGELGRALLAAGGAKMQAQAGAVGREQDKYDSRLNAMEMQQGYADARNQQAASDRMRAEQEKANQINQGLEAMQNAGFDERLMGVYAGGQASFTDVWRMQEQLDDETKREAAEKEVSGLFVGLIKEQTGVEMSPETAQALMARDKLGQATNLILATRDKEYAPRTLDTYTDATGNRHIVLLQDGKVKDIVAGMDSQGAYTNNMKRAKDLEQMYNSRLSVLGPDHPEVIKLGKERDKYLALALQSGSNAMPDNSPTGDGPIPQVEGTSLEMVQSSSAYKTAAPALGKMILEAENSGQPLTHMQIYKRAKAIFEADPELAPYADKLAHAEAMDAQVGTMGQLESGNPMIPFSGAGGSAGVRDRPEQYPQYPVPPAAAGMGGQGTP